MGAHICTRYVLARPDQVDSLVLISPFGLRNQGGRMALIRRWDALLPMASRLVSRRLVQRTTRAWVCRDAVITPELVNTLWRPFRTREGRSVVVQTTRDILGARAMDEILPQIEQRVLILVGDKDPLMIHRRQNACAA